MHDSPTRTIRSFVQRAGRITRAQDELTACTDDFSYENRLLGAVALRRLRYEYALTDDFDLGRSRFGPGAGAMIGAHLERLLGT